MYPCSLSVYILYIAHSSAPYNKEASTVAQLTWHFTLMETWRFFQTLLPKPVLIFLGLFTLTLCWQLHTLLPSSSFTFVPSHFLHSSALEFQQVCIKSMWWLWARLVMLQLSLDHHSASYHNMTRPTISSSHLFDIPYLIHIPLFDRDVIKYVPLLGPWADLSILVCIFVLEDDICNHKDILRIET